MTVEIMLFPLLVLFVVLIAVIALKSKPNPCPRCGVPAWFACHHGLCPRK